MLVAEALLDAPGVELGVQEPAVEALLDPPVVELEVQVLAVALLLEPPVAELEVQLQAEETPAQAGRYRNHLRHTRSR